MAAVLSGNRNFEGRVHPLVRANYLASPPLVVAYALAGTVDIDLTTEPLGNGPRRQASLPARSLADARRRSGTASRASLHPDMFREQYGNVFTGNEMWNNVPVPEAAAYEFSPDSTYIPEPPFFMNLATEPGTPADVLGAKVLGVLGRQRHHRPYLARGQHRDKEPGRPVPALARRAGDRLQPVWRAAWATTR